MRSARAAKECRTHSRAISCCLLVTILLAAAAVPVAPESQPLKAADETDKGWMPAVMLARPRPTIIGSASSVPSSSSSSSSVTTTTVTKTTTITTSVMPARSSSSGTSGSSSSSSSISGVSGGSVSGSSISGSSSSSSGSSSSGNTKAEVTAVAAEEAAPKAPTVTQAPVPAAAAAAAAAAAGLATTTTATTVASPPAAATASTNTGSLNATRKISKPHHPFPQCLNTTLSYDVSFVGKLQYVQVGSVRYAYHRFGPLQTFGVQTPRQSVVFSREVKLKHAPVIFLSGWGVAMYMWPVPLLQRLADSREVVIFDTMRTGRSTDSSTAPLSVPMVADSVAGLITKLGLDKPDVWSWSFGAFVGYGLLAMHREKVGNVIIAAGSPGGPDALLPPQVVTDDIAKAGQNYSALLPYLFPAGAQDDGVCSFYAAYNSFYQSEQTSLPTPLGVDSLQEQSRAAVKFFTDSTIIEKLDATNNRVLILHGVQDRLMPVRNALLGAWKLLGAWMLQFPGEGHAIPFSHVQAVTTTTLQFFSFANPLSQDEMREWNNYGGTASSRILGQKVELVVEAEPVDVAEAEDVSEERSDKADQNAAKSGG